MRELLSRLVSSKKDPEFAETVKALVNKAEYAANMRARGKLTKAEHEDFEAGLYAQYLEALPMDEFVSMQKDGRYAQLETLAGHDGTRDGYDVRKHRDAIEKKITADALDDAWLSQKIDSKRYSEENRSLGTSDDLSQRVTDGDYDGASSEFFATRHDEDPDVSTGTIPGTNVPALPKSITSLAPATASEE
ncbi:MAG: hypothetical protein WC807_21125 [Hyphomicrobium sp.]|jgi:hypothetical protein